MGDPKRYHLTEPTVSIDGKVLGKGWLLITEEEYSQLSATTSPEQIAKPVIAEQFFTNENGNSIHITIRDSVANTDADGVYIEMAGPDSTSTYDMTAMEADWLKTLLQEIM